MSHTTDIESRSNPDGLQEIRSWASRSPQAARPGFRRQSRPRSFRRPLQIAASFGLALLLLILLASSRFSQSRQPPPAPAAQPEAVASSVPVLAEAELPPAEAVAAPPPPPLEPVSLPSARPVVSAREERPRKEEPDRQEPEAAPAAMKPAIVVSRDAFESEPALLLSTPSAEYPAAARGTGTSAKVIVGFTIDETGAVRNPVIESTRIQGDAPKAPFEEAALDAARRARFEPARERGVPARSWNTLTFLFETGAGLNG